MTDEKEITVVLSVSSRRLLFCNECGRELWHERVKTIAKKDVWNKWLFCCPMCRTIVNGDGERI